jgi:Trypsin-like peptidase domain
MDIRDSIAGIVAKSGSEYKYSGTGFFIEGGIILTCAHVVDAAQIIDGRVQIRIEGAKQFYDAKILFKSPEAELDICVLHPIDLDEDVPTLKLVMSRQSGGN